MKKIWHWMMIVCVAGCVGFLVTGCETSDNPDTEDVDSYFEDNPQATPSHGSLPADPVTLVVSVSPSTLSSDGAKATLSVTPGTPPYSWTVQDVNLGSISAASGTSIVYTRLNAGDNAVAVSDRNGNIGNAVISQP